MAHSGFWSSKLAVYHCSFNNYGIVDLTGCTHNGTDVSSSAPIPYAHKLAHTSDTTGERFHTPP